MENTVYNILEAQDQRKQDFIKNFATQITSVDETIADVISEDTTFSAALVAFIRLSLSHLEDSTTTIKNHMKDIYQDNNTNFPSPVSPLPNETNNSSINLDTPPARAYQQKSSQNRNNNKHINDKNSNNHRYTDTSQTTRLEHDTNPVNKTATNQEPQRNNKVTPKKENVNNTNINASCSQSRNDDTSRDQATIIYTRKEKLMDIDVDEIKPSWNDNIDTEVHAIQQDNFNTVELTHNPWSNNTTPIVITSNR